MVAVCQTTGRPEIAPPTWVFGLRQFASELAFSGLFYAAFRRTLPRGTAGAPTAAPVPV
jgi:hypothetical protein